MTECKHGLPNCTDCNKEGYTSWDNYVKEHKEEISHELGSLLLILDELRQWQKSTGGSILARLKIIENWKQSEVSVHGKVQRLEGKVKDLEDAWCIHGEPDSINWLRDKVKDLEEGLRVYRINSNLNGSDIQHLHMTKASIESVEELQKKVKDLEQQNNDFQDWKEKSWPNVIKLISLKNSVEELEESDKLKDDNLHSLYWQIKALEEWKRDIDALPDPSGYIGESKKKTITIDKKVWEHIKRYVGNIQYLNKMPLEQQYHIRYLKDAIKKIDKDFCPNETI